MTIKHLVLLIACALALPSCSILGSNASGFDVYDAYDRPATRPQDPSAVRVKVSISRQRVYVMEGDKALLVMPVSVGVPHHHPTPKGNFRVISKNQYKRTAVHGLAYSGSKIKKTTRPNKPSGWSFKGFPQPYWVEFKPGYGFQTGWIKHAPSTWDGCIFMHHNVAPKFFELVSKGTPVHIATSQPEDSSLGNIPLPPDAGPLPDFPDAFYLSDEPFTRHKEPRFE